MTSQDTAVVTFTVTQLDRVQGAGRLAALAAVEIDVEGVSLLVQGIRVIRQKNRIATQAPHFRDPRTGAWIPALILPDELATAIARELHRMLVCEPITAQPTGTEIPHH